MPLLIVLAGTIFTSGASAQTCATNVPHVQGTWRTLPYLMPINPISATLLRTGKVLIVAGSENDANNNSAGSESYRNAVWDPAGTTGSSISVQNIEYDVFCSGTAALPDGRSLVVGGTASYAFTGDQRASIFDPATNEFVQSQNMANGRWYATATTLGDGRVMAFSGTNLSGSTNNTVEIYDLTNAGAGWTAPATAPFTPPLYPRMFLLPNGKVFYNGQGSGHNANAWIFDPSAKTWTKSATTLIDRTYGSAVILPLLPPNYTPKVMNFGGGSPATATTEIIDLSVTSPNWTAGPSMSTGRIQMNAVMLPNGVIVAEGGSVNNESPDPAGKQTDLYNSYTNAMSSGGTASYSRLYHSTALLLPDATVVSMGSNPGPRGDYEPAMEIYTPPYLYDSNDQLITNRPAISGVSNTVLGYNLPFSVNYTAASNISSAVLVRTGSSTHAFDMDQRLIGLCGPSPQPACSGSGTLSLTTPPNSNIAPPGYYMLFILDSRGVPSVAQFIQLTRYTTTAPRGVIASPGNDMTIPAGQTVSFSTSSSAAKYSWVFPGGSPATSTLQNPGNITFNTPGEYVTSLTLIDSSGNSDPSPPTRTITVLPATPDFDIDVTPSSQNVLPGQSATFTVTVTPKSNFTGTVSLGVSSESGFPAGISSGGFSPASITGGAGTSTLTMLTAANASPFALSLTIKATSGSLSHTGSTTLVVRLASPTSLSASGGSGQVNLSWPSSPGASGYHVKRALVSGGPYVGLGCTNSSTSFTDTAVNNGTTYYYVVSADFTSGPNSGGESSDSVEASATPTGSTDTQPPTAPGSLGATAVSTSQINLTWAASTDNVGVTNYYVERCLASSCTFGQIGIVSPAVRSFSDTGLAASTTYNYRVRATDAAGNFSQYSNTATATTQTPDTQAPTAPGNLNATATGATQINLTWTASTDNVGVTYYYVERCVTSNCSFQQVTTVAGTSTAYSDNGLNPGTGYSYRVRATDAAGNLSGYSNIAGATTQNLAPPAAPANLKGGPGNPRGSVTLTWTQSTSPGVTQNNIYRGASSCEFPLTPTATISANSTFTDTRLTSGTTYCYKVTAVSAGGESTPTGNVFATAK